MQHNLEMRESEVSSVWLSAGLSCQMHRRQNKCVISKKTEDVIGCTLFLCHFFNLRTTSSHSKPGRSSKAQVLSHHSQVFSVLSWSDQIHEPDWSLSQCTALPHTVKRYLRKHFFKVLEVNFGSIPAGCCLMLGCHQGWANLPCKMNPALLSLGHFL